MSPPEGLGDILFFPGRPDVRLSVCHELCPLCNLKTPEAIFKNLETSYKYQSTLDDVQSARTVTLAFIFF